MSFATNCHGDDCAGTLLRFWKNRTGCSVGIGLEPNIIRRRHGDAVLVATKSQAQRV